MRAVLAVVAAMGLAASAQAAPMFSFEGSMNGWVVDGGTATIVNSPIGATDGSQSMALTDGAFGQLKIDLTPAQWADAAAGRSISFDYTVPATLWGSWGGWWGEIGVALNSQAGGWQGSGWVQLDRSVGTHTFSFAFAPTTVIPANPGTYAQMFIQHNWGQQRLTEPDPGTFGPSTLYIDNIAVPEPTVLAGVAISSLGLMIRRRQK